MRSMPKNDSLPSRPLALRRLRPLDLLPLRVRPSSSRGPRQLPILVPGVWAGLEGGGGSAGVGVGEEEEIGTLCADYYLDKIYQEYIIGVNN